MLLAEGDGEGVAIRKNQALSCAEGVACALLGLLDGDLYFIPERAAYWGNPL
jgi:hypothetical protein